MSSVLRSGLVLLGFSALAGSSFAWNDTGHMVVAFIARQELKPRVRAQVDSLLKIGAEEKSQEFVTAACWADDAKTKENGPWHYINYHFNEDGSVRAEQPEKENVVWAIRKFGDVLKNGREEPAKRAEALRYLLHLVGDVHQPLHTSSRHSEKAKEGDRGGNLFSIGVHSSFSSMARPPQNLHFLWDLGGGLFTEERRPLDGASRGRITELAQRLRQLHPLTVRTEMKSNNPEGWAQESLGIAKTEVYTLKEGEVPPDRYLERVKEISGQRAAIAGYRLGDLLNRLLG